MNVLAVVLGGALLLLAAYQAVFAVLFVRLFFRKRCAAMDDQRWPRAAILLSLRGADPYLGKGLRCLMRQDYPSYALWIVVDRRDDPAWAVVEEAIRDTSAANVHLSPLRQRLETCSLKCSALVQMVVELEDSCDVVVQADADLVSHAGWLRELIAPLSDARIGATFGNRWFMPREGRLGSLVRYLWNTAAVVPMWVLGIPWGGTFAVRTEVLRRCKLAEKWARTVVEDAPVRSALRQEGFRVRFVPALMMVNREECSLPFSLDFVKRQLTWTRIYHPGWAPVFAHAIITTGLLAAAAAVSVIAAIAGRWDAAGWAAAGWIGYLAGMLALTALMEAGVRQVVRARGEATDWLSPRTLVLLPLAIPLTQVMHMLAVFMATFRTHVAWRGVTYRVRGPWDVRMVDYRPFEQSPSAADSNTSL